MKRLALTLATTLLAIGALSGFIAGRATATQLRGGMLTPNWSSEAFRMSPEDQRAEIATVAVMGGNVVRLQVDWPSLQPDGPIDQDYLHQLDQAMSSAAEYHQAVILNISGTPCWAALAPDCPVTPKNHMNPPTPAAFAEVSRFLLERYPSLYAYEVWNEPNLPTHAFWKGTVAEFAQIANAAAAAKAQLGSQTRVIVGGFFGGQWGGNGWFLDQLYRAGMHGQDGISLHPYTFVAGRGWTRPSKRSSAFQQQIRGTHQVMLAHGDRGGLYLTEFGYAPCPASVCVPPAIAGRWLADSFRVATRYPYIKALTAFSMRDYGDPSDPSPSWMNHSGIIGRPAFWDLRKTFKQLRKKEHRRKKHKHHAKRG